MKVLLTLVVLVACVYLGQANDCVDSSVLCKLRKADCKDNDFYKQICPFTCGECKSKKLYKLTYFDLRVRGEQIRWILEQGEANWEDIRIKQEDWPALKPKTQTGQMPFLEVDNTTISQSGAIAMYLAKELDLAGSNNLETAQVHMIWDTVQETFNAAGAALLTRDPVLRKQKEKEYYGEKFPRLIRFLEDLLQGGQEWLVGDKVTIADIITASFMDSQIGAEAISAVKASKSVSALTEKVKSFPRIKNWIATRPKTDL